MVFNRAPKLIYLYDLIPAWSLKIGRSRSMDIPVTLCKIKLSTFNFQQDSKSTNILTSTPILHHPFPPPPPPRTPINTPIQHRYHRETLRQNPCPKHALRELVVSGADGACCSYESCEGVETADGK